VADGRAKMDAWIAALRTLPVDLVTASTPEVAKALEDDIKASANAGAAPDGSAWQKTESGAKALPNAADRVKVEHSGSVVLARLKGNEVRHHKGTARGGIRRQILPTRKIPDNVAVAIRRVFGKHFTRLVGGE
jgi:hypothetical protein